MEKNIYSINSNHIWEQIFCKLIKSTSYVSAFFPNVILNIFTIVLEYTSTNIRKLTIIESIKVEQIPNYDNIILYDTNTEFYKILCCGKIITNNKKCNIVYSEVKNDNQNDNYVIISELNLTDINRNYDVSFTKNHEGYFHVFNDECFLCCDDDNIISCYRNNISNFNLINQFSINSLGQISNIIIKNEVYYEIISDKNESSDKSYLYNYYIYPPKCMHFNSHINPYQTLEIN